MSIKNIDNDTDIDLQGEETILTINEEDRNNFLRLDQYLSSKIDYSRNFLKNLFQNDLIVLDEENIIKTKLQLNKMPPAGTVIQVLIPPPPSEHAEAQDIPLEILFEDEYLVFVNKPAGLVVHPAPGHPDKTLVNALLHHCPDIKGVGGNKRPGIVHRLDKGTSGVMVVAKDIKCHEKLVTLFSKHDIERRYMAIAMGLKMPKEGTLEATIGRHKTNRKKMAANVRGKEAITHYKVEEFFKRCSLIECKLETGRTHQIRVHLSSLLNAAVLNDSMYGKTEEHKRRIGGTFTSVIGSYEHPFLHAKILGLTHPMTGEKLYFDVPPPKEFQEVLEYLRKECE